MRRKQTHVVAFAAFVALIAAAGCSDNGGSSPSTGGTVVPETAASSLPDPLTPGAADDVGQPDEIADGFDGVAWTADNQEEFDRATTAMERFADAVEVGEVDGARSAAVEVRDSMSGLAATLDDETEPQAVDLRSGLLDCSTAYGAFDDAMARGDAEALDATADLFRRCLGVPTVDEP